MRIKILCREIEVSSKEGQSRKWGMAVLSACSELASQEFFRRLEAGNLLQISHPEISPFNGEEFGTLYASMPLSLIPVDDINWNLVVNN